MLTACSANVHNEKEGLLDLYNMLEHQVCVQYYWVQDNGRKKR